MPSSWQQPAPLVKKETSVRALVIDDSRTIRTILGRLLRQLGFEVKEAANCLEAIEHLKADAPPALATLDWNMPGMSGLEFLQWVRAQDAFNAMRVVMVTTETEMTQLDRALRAGADEYVMKPFTAEVIREKLLLLGILPQATTASLACAAPFLR